ncbi:MAG: 3-deoxy-manno-octulosonate cytidylyltransferase [Alphaproteobacteria bacterium]
MNPLIIIPARMASTRLPGKPLADIHGRPMIAHVVQRAEEAKAGPVWVACAESAIGDAVEHSGGRYVITDPDLPSGTDRVLAAATVIDPDKKFDIVINVQGDMPALNPSLISDVLKVLTDNPDCDIATAVVETDSAREKSDPNVVKAVITACGRALYFTRAHAPTGDGPVFHHVGLYAYRRAALERFCSLPPSPLEIRERLEQLRALEDGMIIYAAIVKTAPDGVDTPDDLDRARKILGPQS